MKAVNENGGIALEEARAFLRRALPEADLMTLPEEALDRVARHALAVREAAPWGACVPRDIFLAYVLFPRVNDEAPAAYHAPLWEALRARVSGLDMAGAALEVNRWCFEQATYRSTDARTADALTVIRRGFGRCGEESVLLTCALRACGLPARQLYAPLWSHCDDNHAWVEVWADGDWHYMGACEPETALDSGWFTAAASKAMLVRTRAFGILPAGERAELRRGTAWIVNRTAAYARTRLLTVRVSEGGAPLMGIRVAFELCNMAAFRPICEKATDACGRAELLTGLGTLRVRATDGRRYIEADVDVSRQGELAPDSHDDKHDNGVDQPVTDIFNLKCLSDCLEHYSTSHVPPAASIFALAPSLVTTLTVSFFVSSALPMIFTPSFGFLTIPRSIRLSTVTSAPSSNLLSAAISTATTSLVFLFVKPLLGSLLYNGI